VVSKTTDYHTVQSIPGILFEEEVAKLCFSTGNELQICHGNFLLMDNKHGKLFVIQQSEGYKFMPNIYA